MPPCRYPLNAFFPHAHSEGLVMGEKAEAERYCFVFEDRYKVRAPCPPMLCPKIDCRLKSCETKLATLTWNQETTTDNREPSSFYNLRQLNRDMSGHVVIFGILRFSCIKVKASTSSKFPVIVLSWNSCTTRRSIWEQYCDTLGRSYSQKASFLCSGRK